MSVSSNFFSENYKNFIHGIISDMIKRDFNISISRSNYPLEQIMTNISGKTPKLQNISNEDHLKNLVLLKSFEFSLAEAKIASTKLISAKAKLSPNSFNKFLVLE